MNPVGIHWAVSFVFRVEWLRLKRGADLRTDWHRAELPYRYVPLPLRLQTQRNNRGFQRD